PLLGLAPEGDEHRARDQRALLQLEVLVLPHVAEHVGHRLAHELRRQPACRRGALEQAAGPLTALGDAVLIGHLVLRSRGARAGASARTGGCWASTTAARRARRGPPARAATRA